jgi:hypothetical protein
VTTKDKIINAIFKGYAEIKSLLTELEKWFGLMKRMVETRLPRKALQL